MLQKLLNKFGYIKQELAGVTVPAPLSSIPAEAKKYRKSLVATLKAHDAWADNALAKIKEFKAQKIEAIEKELQKVPAGAQCPGAAIALVEGEVKLLTFKTKQEALDILAKAKKGELSLVF